jgi:ferrochelatase
MLGVLIMAYGSPESLDDMAPYLLDIRRGRPAPPELVAEMTDRYAMIGGSPLMARTREQSAAVQDELRRRGNTDATCYLGMRHWDPRVADAVRQMAADGVSEAVGIVMAPHFAEIHIGAYRELAETAAADIGANFRLRCVDSWASQPQYLAAQQRLLNDAIARLPSRDDTALLFTAHSLPTRIVADNDPYGPQLRQTAAALAAPTGLPWHWAYQSISGDKAQWLGPSLDDVLVDLAGAGVKTVITAPIGFVCDHVEVLYDLDIEAAQQAAELGISLSRTEMPNANPTFIAAIADAVEGALD